MAHFAPDYYKAIEPMIKAAEGQPPAPPPKNVLELRAAANALMTTAFQNSPSPAEIVQTTHEIAASAAAGGGAVTVTRFATAAQRAATGQPAVVYLHPGGMVCGSVPMMASLVANEAASAGVQHWAVHYTLSPEATAPTALEQAYAVLAHLSTHAAEFGLDNTRLAVAGASAGGGMAAGLGLLARDRGLSPPLAKLVLIYPMLDDRTVQAHPPVGARHAGANTRDEAWDVRPFLTWTCEQNALAWAAYLGLSDAPRDDAPACAALLANQAAVAAATAGAAAYAVPARAATLKGLPSTYIDCGGLDLFLEECTQFAARLARDQVEFDLHIFNGVPHAFEMAASCNAAKSALELRKLAFNSF